MQYRDEANLCTETVGVKRDLLQGLSDSREQQVVATLWIDAKKRMECGRNGENDVKVLNGQQVFLSGFEPASLIETWAFWTVAIETRVVEVYLVVAMVAPIHMAAERLGSTIENVVHCI